MKSTIISPSILSADFANLERDVQAVEEAGADWIHIDVMDGHFVPNITLGPPVIKSLRKSTTLPFDVHLMIENPERYISSFANAGADIITVHAEACPHLDRVVAQIKECGKSAGVALNPHTHESVLDYVLGELDLILVMTVNPGFGGQSYLSRMENKVASIRKSLDENDYEARIEVDGGINPQTSKAIRLAGADTLVAGSAIFKAKNYAEAITAIRG